MVSSTVLMCASTPDNTCPELQNTCQHAQKYSCKNKTAMAKQLVNTCPYMFEDVTNMLNMIKVSPARWRTIYHSCDFVVR